MIRNALLLSLCLFLGSCTKSPQTFKTQKDLQSHYRKEIQKTLNAKKINSLSLALFNKDGIIWTQGFGDATPETIYRIGSITKLFTGTAVMQLIEEKKLSLNQPLSDFHPNLAKALKTESQITLQDLLTHQAGFAKDHLHGMLTKTPESQNDFLKKLSPLDLARPPKTAFQYSNIDYAILGTILEKRENQAFSKLIKARIITPLKLQDTHFDFEKTDKSRFSKLYLNGKEQPHYPIRDLSAGGLYSTVQDLAKFGGAFLDPNNTQLLSTPKKYQMTSAQNYSTAAIPQEIGITWFILRGIDDRPTKLILHDGATLFSRSHFVLAPEYGLGIAVLSNSAEATEAVHEFGFDILAATIKHRHPIPKQEKTLPTATQVKPEEIPGIYATPIGLIKIQKNGNALRTKALSYSLKLKKDKNNFYRATYLLFGKIPIKIPQLHQIPISIFRSQSHILIGPHMYGSNFAIADKLSPTLVPEKWKNRFATYKLTNPDPNGYNPIKELTLTQKKGHIVAIAKAEILKSMIGRDTLELALNPLSNTLLEVRGITAPWSGKIQYTPSTKTLNFMGYQFKKQTQ